MSLFSKPTVVLWPKSDSLEIFLNQKNNNSLALKINLWSKCTESEIKSVNTFLSQNKIDNCQILIPDDVVFTKSFVYDTKTESVDKNEVISLAESFVHFKINPDYVEYKLLQTETKTIIQANIYDPAKFDLLKENLKQTSLKTYSTVAVSGAIAKIIPTLYDQEYFLLYPLNESESTLILSKNGIVYLTANFKTSALDVQKIINYSKLYFESPVKKFFYTEADEPKLIITSELDKTPLNQTQVAATFGRPGNFPIPVVGVLADKPIKVNKADIINPPMENKKNIWPLVAVFIVGLAITSVVIWYVLNKDNQGVQNPAGNNQITPTVEVVVPTDIPTVSPTVADINKSIKIQVLNGTDINGQAASLKEKITKLGFTNVATGNSTEKSTKNILRLKEAATADYFTQNLGDYFSFSTETLPANSTYDAVFLIGTKLGAESSPSASVTKKPTASPTEEP